MNESRNESRYENEMEDVYFQEKFERRKRLRIIATVAPGVIAILLILMRMLYVDRYVLPGITTDSYGYNLLILTSFGASAMGLLMIYLQTGFRRSSAERSYMYDLQNELTSKLDRMESEKYYQAEKFDEVSKRISELDNLINKSINTASTKTDVLSNDEKNFLFNSIKASIENDSSERIFNDLTKRVELAYKTEDKHKIFQSSFKETLNRLHNEVTSLSRRGNLNLSLGILTTVTGLGILGYFVVQTNNHGTDLPSFLIGFLPRLSLVLLIEVFAYFFLKLYKSSLSEIKYFQNEMTNVEAKYIALVAAIGSSTDGPCSEVIKGLCATERNHVLEKGQTTVELEKAKVDKEEITSLLKSLSELIKKQK